MTTNSKKKIMVFTGSRSEYGILRPLMKAIQNDPSLDLMILATGSHLSELFGQTINEIQKDGFVVDYKIGMDVSDDSGLAMAQAIGQGIIEISQALKKAKPDMLLVCGDRGEALAVTVAAVYQKIAVVHLWGGDRASGANIDDSIRHAITKFAHIHLAVNKQHAQRITKLGEEKSRIFVTGSPSVDSILAVIKNPDKAIFQKFGIDPKKPLALMVQHPTTIDLEKGAKEIKETLEALRETKIQSIVIYPNFDAGSRSMAKTIAEYEGQENIKIFKSLSFLDYLNLMKIADVIVGNSSSGIIEAPIFGLPSVNIGERQKGRAMADNVINVGYDKKQIIKAIKKATTDKKFLAKARKSQNFYGDGKASSKIVNILKKIEIDNKLLMKKITY